jgi:DNA polymerase I-like protein with 3'-5' exonuclease and polymerase domains
MITIFDVETTTSNKGNPFDQTNKLCYVGVNSPDSNTGGLFDIEYSDHGGNYEVLKLVEIFKNSTVLVGFNIKFDLHWIKFYGIDFSHCRIWDCQVVHFILTGQKETYPSLNSVAAYYGLGTKHSEVEEYWNKGLDTTQIPRDILEKYLQQDLDLTEQVYYKQLEEISKRSHLRRLVSLHNQDLLVLQEMEYNGLLYDSNKSEELAIQTEKDIEEIDGLLSSYVSFDGFNFNSNDHLSCLLYGGSIPLRRQEEIGVFKTGERKGQTKYKWVEYFEELPRLVKPLKGSELQKEGYYSTDEQTLRTLRGNKKAMELIELLLKRAELSKRVSTYYRGLLKLQDTMNWKKGMIHGQLNQTVARTGRLSSSRPNLQNFDGEIKELFYSRFA